MSRTRVPKRKGAPDGGVSPPKKPALAPPGAPAVRPLSETRLRKALVDYHSRRPYQRFSSVALSLWKVRKQRHIESLDKLHSFTQYLSGQESVSAVRGSLVDLCEAICVNGDYAAKYGLLETLRHVREIQRFTAEISTVMQMKNFLRNWDDTVAQFCRKVGTGPYRSKKLAPVELAWSRLKTAWSVRTLHRKFLLFQRDKKIWIRSQWLERNVAHIVRFLRQVFTDPHFCRNIPVCVPDSPSWLMVQNLNFPLFRSDDFSTTVSFHRTLGSYIEHPRIAFKSSYSSVVKGDWYLCLDIKTATLRQLRGKESFPPRVQMDLFHVKGRKVRSYQVRFETLLKSLKNWNLAFGLGGLVCNQKDTLPAGPSRLIQKFGIRL